MRYQQQRLLSLALFSGKTHETSMSQGQIFNAKLRNFCKQKILLILLMMEILMKVILGIKKLHLNRKGNSTLAKNFVNYLGNY